MTQDRFWELIAESRRDFDPNRRDGNMAAQARRLEQLLSALPAAEVADFDRIFLGFSAGAYCWDLWSAATIIEDGCSDDGFMDFRNWLISMGREVYEAAIADPESLAEVAVRLGIEDCSFEGFGSIATSVLEKKGAPEPSGFRHPPEPAGQRREQRELPARFPRLWAKFGEPSR